jgi:hypothetical protein
LKGHLTIARSSSAFKVILLAIAGYNETHVSTINHKAAKTQLGARNSNQKIELMQTTRKAIVPRSAYG